MTVVRALVSFKTIIHQHFYKLYKSSWFHDIETLSVAGRFPHKGSMMLSSDLYILRCWTFDWVTGDFRRHDTRMTLTVTMLGYGFTREHFVCPPNQRETTLHCNVASHWLGVYTKWSMLYCNTEFSPVNTLHVCSNNIIIMSKTYFEVIMLLLVCSMLAGQLPS